LVAWSAAATSTSTTVPVDVVRIDEALERGERIALLKIDCEGVDTWALMGCEALLANRLIDCIWFEQHRPPMRALGIGDQDAQVFLRRCGYLANPRGDATGEVVNWSAVPA
jgi:hypothetical protein